MKDIESLIHSPRFPKNSVRFPETCVPMEGAHVRSIPNLLWVFLIAAADCRAQWVPTQGPPGHTVSAMAAKGKTVFAGTLDEYGLFSSMGTGEPWTPINGFGTGEIMSLLLSGSQLFAGSSDGLFRTTDNGGTWTGSNQGLTPHRIACLVAGGEYLFAGTDSGVFRSGDSGVSWSALGNDIGKPSVNAFASRPFFLFAGTQTQGVYRTVDNGDSWATVGVGWTGGTVLSLAGRGLVCLRRNRQQRRLPSLSRRR